MSKDNRKLRFALGGLGVALAGWLGASFYAGHAAERDLRAFAARPAAETGVRIHSLQHHAGLLSSSGTFAVELAGQCADAQPVPGAALEVSYQLDHRLLPSAPLRMAWQAGPDARLAAALGSVAGEAARARGAGTLSYAGELRSTVTLPELALALEGRRLAMSPSSASVTFGKTALAVRWNVERLHARGLQDRLELGGVALDMNLDNRHLGTGTTTLSVEHLVTGHGTAQGLQQTLRVTEEGDRLQARLAGNLGAAAFAGETAQGLDVALAVRDLDRKSVETLGRVMGASCGLRHLGPDADLALRSALRTLLTRGFSAGIEKVAGTLGEGRLEGRLVVAAGKAPADGGPVSLASLLHASGEVVLKGGPQGERRLTSAWGGLLAAADGGLKGGFEYVDGVLRADGLALDGALVQARLDALDRALNAFFDQPRFARNAPPAEPVHVPAPLATDGPAAGRGAAPAMDGGVPPAVAQPAVLPLPVRPILPAQPGMASVACGPAHPCPVRAL